MNQRAISSRRGSSGFTLIEIMVTVAIIAVLSSIAVPAYTDHVRRTQATDATSNLAAGRTRLEQFFQDNRNYGSTATTCGITVAASTSFAYTCNWGAGGTNQSFRITATGSPGGTSHVYTITDSGARTTTTFKGVAQTGKNCWLLRGGEC